MAHVQMFFGFLGCARVASKGRKDRTKREVMKRLSLSNIEKLGTLPITD